MRDLQTGPHTRRVNPHIVGDRPEPPATGPASVGDSHIIRWHARHGRPGAERLRRQSVRQAAALGVVLLAAALAMVPSWYPTWYQDDQLPSVFRTLHTDLARHQGVLFPRMAFDLGFGYGQLLHQVYPPLGFELTAWLHALGLGYIESVRAFFSLCLVLGALGMYGYGRAVLGWHLGPVLAAVAYAWAPYTLLDAHPGGDFGESLAIGLLPWSVWGFHALTVRPSWARFAAATLALAAVALAHNITALFLTGLICLYVAMLSARIERQAGRAAAGAALARSGTALILALALAAVYWAPALLEMSYTRIGEQRQGTFSVEEYLLPLRGLLQSSLVYSYDLEQQHRFGLAHALLTATAALAVAGALTVRRRPSAHISPDRLVLASCACLFVSMLALQLRLSEPIWDTVPLISFAQFPRRLYVFATFAAAIIIGALPWALGRLGLGQTGQVVATGLATALFAATSLPGVYWPAPVARSHVLTEDQVAIGSTADQRFSQRSAYDDFMPARVSEKQVDIPRPPRQPDLYRRANELPAPRVELLEWSYQRALLRTEADTESAVILHRFFFPGWHATVSGRPAAVEPVGPLGLTGVTIPPGRHDVVVTFGETPLRVASVAISIGAAGLVILALLRAFGAERTVLGLVVGGIVVLLPWTSHLSAARPPVSEIQPRDLAVTPTARIVGITEPRDRRYDPGDTVQLTVYWQAITWTSLDLRSSLQLTSHDDATVLAERWSRPNLGRTPTAKWVLGLIVPDQLRIEIPASLPAGRYRLLAGLRDNIATSSLPVAEIVVGRE